MTAADRAAALALLWEQWGVGELSPFLVTLAMRRRGRKRGDESTRGWLDLCCGSGALLQAATKAGFRSIGVDHVGSRHKRVGSPQFIRGDARTVRLDQHFDVVSCVGGSVHDLGNLREVDRVLATARRHLTPRGVMLIDMNCPDAFHTLHGQPQVIENGCLTLIATPWCSSAPSSRHCNVEVQVIGFIRRGRTYERFELTHSLVMFERREMESLLDRRGWKCRAWDLDTLGPAGKRAERIVYVCRRG